MKVELYNIRRSPFRWGDCVLKFKDLDSSNPEQRLDIHCPKETEADDALSMWEHAHWWFKNREEALAKKRGD